MFSLNNYAIENNKYFTENNKTLYRGVNMTLSSLLPYERAKGQIISFTSFTSISTEKKVAKRFARKRDNKNQNKKNQFSVIFEINHLHDKNWIPNGIDIHDIARYKNEKEILFSSIFFLSYKRCGYRL